MDKRPSRRKFKDNPYRLESIERKEIYIINFTDNKGIKHSIQVDKKIFDLFDESEKYENAKFFEYYKYYNHKNININNIRNKSSVEDHVLNKISIDELRKSLNFLPEIQKSRIIKYFFENKTYEEIGNEEGCSKMAVKYSIDIALQKLSKKFKN
ncbi:MAG: hypothetical protein IKF19_05265 [Bacilli bacterium]|nr:hypothetical protein [Bacilli bacterium]